MLNFNFNMPAKLVCGRGCVQANAELLKNYKNALIVTGKSSAKLSGALDDMTAVLEKNGTAYTVFDKITENPLISTCLEGGVLAAETDADLVIAIGGGSALDAGKAVAAFAMMVKNAGTPIDPMALFTAAGNAASLPIVAIPTTSGTGSEANPYSVLTLDTEATGKDGDIVRKKTFNSPNSYPKIAFLDAKYTETMTERTTISTALDALCHCIESYMSPKSTAISQMFAVYGAKLITIVMAQTENRLWPLTSEQREMLMYASCAGGIAINTTGTGFPHPLGYNLTFGRNVPHGAACAIFMEEFIRYTSKSVVGEIKIASFMEEIGFDSAEFAQNAVNLARAVIGLSGGEKMALSDDEIALYIGKTADAGNYKNNPYVICEAEMDEIYRRI